VQHVISTSAIAAFRTITTPSDQLAATQCCVIILLDAPRTLSPVNSRKPNCRNPQRLLPLAQPFQLRGRAAPDTDRVPGARSDGRSKHRQRRPPAQRLNAGSKSAPRHLTLFAGASTRALNPGYRTSGDWVPMPSPANSRLSPKRNHPPTLVCMVSSPIQSSYTPLFRRKSGHAGPRKPVRVSLTG
jgi:hypothetical protein